MDGAIYAAGVVSPMMTLPQIWQIWEAQSAEGVSLITWSSYLFFSVLWLFYGVIHKEKPIIISNALWIGINATIVSQIFIFS